MINWKVILRMIFYFSGTGNSLYAAKKIGKHNNEVVVSISTAFNNEKFEYTLKENEVIGFVLPLIALSAPKMVFDFIEKLKLNNYKNNYLFVVATYAQNITKFINFFVNPFKNKGLKLNSGFSLNMPMNYFYIWDEQRQKECLKNAEITLKRINEVLEKRHDNVFDIAPCY